MQALSADARALFATGTMRNHRMATRAELWRGGRREYVPVITGGSVTIDGGEAIRRRCTVDLAHDDALVPRSPSDLLYPGSTELRLWRGVDWGDGRPGLPFGAGTGLELWPVGIFLILQTKISDRGEGRGIQLGGYDRAKRLQRNAWTAPYTIAAGTDAIVAWQALITDRYPAAEFNIEVSDTTTVRRHLFGNKPGADPWKDARKLASQIGAEAFVNVDGLFTIRTVQEMNSLPVVATLGETDNRMTGLDLDLDADKGYNTVVVDADASKGTPLRGFAQNADANSPTDANGDYGVVTRFISGSKATTQAQIDTQAAARLRRGSGALETVSVSLVPCAALEPDDVIRLNRPELGITDKFSIDSYTLPLDSSSEMTAAVRRVVS